MTSSLEGEGGVSQKMTCDDMMTQEGVGGSRKMTWWQGGGGRGGVWIPPKIDDVIYEQPLIGKILFSNKECRLQPEPQIFLCDLI